MTRDLDPSSVPDPFATLDPLSAVQLVEVSGGSETFDRRVPVSLRHHDVAGDKYVPRGVLSVRGVLGAPLTEGRVWCAVLTRGLRDIDGGHLQPSEAFRRDLAMADHLGPLRAWLHHSPLRHDDIAVATCFTTQDATGDLEAIRAGMPGDLYREVCQPSIGRVVARALSTAERGFSLIEQAGYPLASADAMGLVRMLFEVRGEAELWRAAQAADQRKSI